MMKGSFTCTIHIKNAYTWNDTNVIKCKIIGIGRSKREMIRDAQKQARNIKKHLAYTLTLQK